MNSEISIKQKKQKDSNSDSGSGNGPECETTQDSITLDKKVSQYPRKEFPRDHFYEKEQWSKDETQWYYQGIEQKYYWPLAKLGLVVIFVILLRLGFNFPWLSTMGITILALVTYQ